MRSSLFSRSRSRSSRPLLVALFVSLVACGGGNSSPGPAPKAPPPPPQPPAPCFNIQADNSELRAKDAQKTIDDLAKRIHLSTEDEALRHPKSMADIRMILRRDSTYLFADAAAYAHTLNTVEGRSSEAMLYLLLGESQLIASQVLTAQAAWAGANLRVARASLASEGEGSSPASNDRMRMLAQLVRVVEEGNKVADALGIVGPTYLTRGAEVIRQLRKEAPNEPRTFALVAEYHRLRGEWSEFDEAMKLAEGTERESPALRYLRGMEQLERYRRPDLGANVMRETLAKYPKLVRAQAALVLMATNPGEALREITKLRQMNQDHYLVMLLEPTLAADQELMRMQRMIVPPAPSPAPPVPPSSSSSAATPRGADAR